MTVRGVIAWGSFKFQVSGSKFPDNLKHETSNLKPSIETLDERRATHIVATADRRLQRKSDE
jgi:hypothetical protein